MKYEKKERKPEPETAGRTENFASRNVKTITFVCCIAVFLAVFGPFSVFRIREYLNSRQEPPAETVMTEADLCDLARDREYLLLSDFQTFRGDLQEWDFGTFYTIRIEPDLIVAVGSDPKTGRVNYFKVRNTDTNREVDVLTGDLDAFLKEN